MCFKDTDPAFYFSFLQFYKVKLTLWVDTDKASLNYLLSRLNTVKTLCCTEWFVDDNNEDIEKHKL